MTPGLREYKAATLRVAVPDGLPPEMHEHCREIVSLRSTKPRSGFATLLMWQTVAEADRDGVVLLLRPLPFDDGMPEDKLIAFYERFGFVLLPQELPLMARAPRGSVQ